MEIALGSYHDTNGIALAISIYRFPEDYIGRPKIRTRALRYLFSHRNRYSSVPTIDELSRWATEMFQEFTQNNNLECMAEIADIMTQFAQERDRNIFLDRLRTLDDEKAGFVRQSMDRTNRRIAQVRANTEKSVYGDSQNVHNSEINKSVIKCLEYLFEKYEDMIILREIYDNGLAIYRPTTNKEKFVHKVSMLTDIRGILVAKHPDKAELVNTSLDYVKTSTAIFGQRELGLIDCVISLWLWISEHEHKKELYLRLLEEFKEMHGMCTTGHIARMINVMQGFTEDENLCIRISSRDQCVAVVKQYLTKSLQDCTDEDVIAGMTDGSPKYIKYIRQCVAKKLIEWKNEYGKEMLDDIASIVNDFAHAEVFT